MLTPASASFRKAFAPAPGTFSIQIVMAGRSSYSISASSSAAHAPLSSSAMNATVSQRDTWLQAEPVDQETWPMTTLDEIWPVFGLRIEAGPIELSAICDDNIPLLVDLASDGIHEPGAMPFAIPWSTATDLGHGMAAYYWRTRPSSVLRRGPLIFSSATRASSSAVRDSIPAASW